jgi:hypothetical protein
MTQLILERFNYSETETEGHLWLNDNEFVHTLERPWIDGVPGGMPFESCVPDGEYMLIQHERPNGDRVFALRNPALSVFYTKQERGSAPGRYLILLHSANYVEQVVGCIAPGMVRTIYENKRMVRSSREAMRKIMARKYTSIEIRPACGTEI